QALGIINCQALVGELAQGLGDGGGPQHEPAGVGRGPGADLTENRAGEGLGAGASAAVGEPKDDGPGQQDQAADTDDQRGPEGRRPAMTTGSPVVRARDGWFRRDWSRVISPPHLARPRSADAESGRTVARSRLSLPVLLAS